MILDASPERLHAGDERSNQPIHWAAMTRQIDVIDELLARGADIDAARGDGARPIQLTNGDYHIGSTPLGWAARYGRLPMVELLLQRGAKPDLPDDPP